MAALAALMGVFAGVGTDVEASWFVEPLWVSRFDGAASVDYAESLALSPDGSRVYVTGFTSDAQQADYATLAYEAATGSELWLRTYGATPGQSDSASSVAVSADGTRVYVTGDSYGSPTTRTDYATVAYDAITGTQRWVARYDVSTGWDEAVAIDVGPDGRRVFVTGIQSFPATDYGTVAYDAFTGAELWRARYDTPVQGRDEPFAIVVSPDGTRVFVTGLSTRARRDRDYATVAYDTETGQQLWVARHGGPGTGNDTGWDIGASPDGTRVFVTGTTHWTGNNEDYGTLAYDAVTGELLWFARYDGPAGSEDNAFALDVSPDGNTVFVTGQSPTGTFVDLDWDFATLAYDAVTGVRRWVARFDGPGDSGETAWDLAVSPDGSRVFVTGSGGIVGELADYVTVAYDSATGRQLGIGGYNGSGDSYDVPTSIGVSPSAARVYVTGRSYGVGIDWDYATVAWEAITVPAVR